MPGTGGHAWIRRRLAALIALALFPPLGSVADSNRVSLFANEARAPAVPRQEWPSPESAIDETAERSFSRIARVDLGGLAGIRDGVAAGRSGALRLNLFHDIEFEATIERSAPTSSGYSLSGPLVDVPFGRVVLVVNGDYTVGRVYTPGGAYAIRTTGHCAFF